MTLDKPTLYVATPDCIAKTTLVIVPVIVELGVALWVNTSSPAGLPCAILVNNLLKV